MTGTSGIWHWTGIYCWSSHWQLVVQRRYNVPSPPMMCTIFLNLPEQIGGFHLPFWCVGGIIIILAILLFLLVKPTSTLNLYTRRTILVFTSCSPTSYAGCSSAVFSLRATLKLICHLNFSMLGNLFVQCVGLNFKSGSIRLMVRPLTTLYH